jgi:hypothetical protein
MAKRPPEDKIVAVNPSKSNPDITHYVCIGDDTILYCTCPCWTRGTYKGVRNGGLPSEQRNCGHKEDYLGLR